jgi:hypothetical protein
MLVAKSLQDASTQKIGIALATLGKVDVRPAQIPT